MKIAEGIYFFWIMGHEEAGQIILGVTAAKTVIEAVLDYSASTVSMKTLPLPFSS